MTKTSPRTLRSRFTRRVAPLAVFGMAIGICGGGWLGLALAVAGLFALLICCFESDGEFRLFGPFLKSELIRSGRGSRRNFWRPIYATLTFAGLLFIYWQSSPELLNDSKVINSNTTQAIQAANERFFFTYAFCLAIYTAYLTTNVFSSFVAEERESQRWDILRVTHLTTREILLGKALGRLPQVLDPVITTIPVIAISTLIGGVSPYMVLLLVINIISIVILIGGITMFYSTFLKSPIEARGVAFGLVGTYHLATFLSMILEMWPGVLALPQPYFSFPVDIGDILGWFQSGNLLILFYHSSSLGLGLEDQLSYIVQRFAAFSVLFGTLFTLVAIARMRTATAWRFVEKAKSVRVKKTAVDTNQSDPQKVEKNEDKKSVVQNQAFSNRPEIGDEPVSWWEQFGIRTRPKNLWEPAYNWKGLLRTAFVMFLFLFAFRILFAYEPLNQWSEYAFSMMHIAIGLFFLLISFLLTFGTMFRCARTIPIERSARTLEPLLTTALSTDDILIQKWKGCVLVNRVFILIGLAALIAFVLTGFINTVAAICFALSMVIYTAASGALGLSIGVTAEKPEIAVRNLLIILVSAGVGFALIGCIPLPPFAAMTWLLLYSDYNTQDNGMILLTNCFGSLFIWSVVGLIAWNYSRSAFSKVMSQ